MNESLRQFIQDALYAAALAAASGLARDFKPAVFERVSHADLLCQEFGRELDARLPDVVADWSRA